MFDLPQCVNEFPSYACSCSASATVAISTVIFLDGFAKYIQGAASTIPSETPCIYLVFDGRLF